MSDKIRELAETLTEKGKTHVKTNVFFANVKEIDWAAKTMTATGVGNELDYFDVLLGLGAMQIKPKINSLCLLGIVENKEAETFLIDAFEIETIYLNGVEIVINDGENEGLVKIGALVEKMNAAEEKLNDMIGKWNAFCANYAPGSPATVGLPATLATQTLEVITVTEKADLENEKVKH